MNKFLEIKERGEMIRFSELLEDIPPDDVLIELLPNLRNPGEQLVTHRGLEVLKLRLEGLRQPEIAEKLGLTPGQVAYASMMAKNCLYRNIPPCLDVDIPSLRKILNMQPKERNGYTQLSELLRDMPSDEELLKLFVERGNILCEGGKSPPTNRDLQLLQMRQKRQSYANIGEETGMDAKEVRHHISLVLRRIQRDLKIELDVPALCKKKKDTGKRGTASRSDRDR